MDLPPTPQKARPDLQVIVLPSASFDELRGHPPLHRAMQKLMSSLPIHSKGIPPILRVLMSR
jgi:hypothetical protein